MKVIITGGGRGIGRGIATFLARNGFEVGILSRSKVQLESVQREIEVAEGHCEIAPCDIRQAAEVTAAVELLTSRLEGVDALINNAGLIVRKDVFDITVEEWLDMVATNLNGLFFTTRAVLPYFVANGGGHILNVSSISGRVPLPGGSGYAATKYAVAGFSESLFHELRDKNIKVTTLFPGSVDSESHRGDRDGAWKVKPEEVGKACRDILRTGPGTVISQVEIRPLRKPPGN